MLLAFLDGVANSNFHNYLDNSIGLKIAKIIDEVSKIYSLKQKAWLKQELLKSHNEFDKNLKYALSEIASIKKIQPDKTMKKRIIWVYDKLKSEN